jgi:hypothetical protein
MSKAKYTLFILFIFELSLRRGGGSILPDALVSRVVGREAGGSQERRGSSSLE